MLGLIGVTIWALYQNTKQRRMQRAHDHEAQSNWENEGGAVPIRPLQQPRSTAWVAENLPTD